MKQNKPHIESHGNIFRLYISENDWLEFDSKQDAEDYMEAELINNMHRS